MTARFSFDTRTGELGYIVRTSGASPDEIAGIYLHRRANRTNGGVAFILSKSSTSSIAGKVVLTEAEANDLKGGKFYISAISRKSPRLSARANLALPSA
jgi:hypothetical protein